jgi:methyltransferase (TIGR00027 family)
MPDARPHIQHVSDTAFLVARYRAIETARSDALFHDPYAERLAGEKGRAAGKLHLTRKITIWSVAIRTVIIDEMIKTAVRNGVTVIVNLGAGLDARPYRLDLPEDLTWIEADYQDVLTYKERVLAADTPCCKLERVAVDLADSERRKAFLQTVADRGAKTLFLTEGVVPYIDESDVGDLAEDLYNVSNVYGWIVDYFSPENRAHRDKSGVTQQMRNAPFKFWPKDWFRFFEQHGWKVRDIMYLPRVARLLKRRAPLPWKRRVQIQLIRMFGSSEKREALGKSLAYVMLEPVTDRRSRVRQ